MAGVPRWIDGEKQQVTWLVASAGSPPLRQAATTLSASNFAFRVLNISSLFPGDYSSVFVEKCVRVPREFSPSSLEK
jgi:hypothetical protein